MSRYHHQNLTDGKLPLWRYGRAWWGRLHWGWHAFHRTELLSVSVRKWGFSIYLRAFGFYFGDNRDYSEERGRWQISWNDGCLWLEHPWVRQDGWVRSDPWWKKMAVLHVVDWLLGRSRCEHTTGKPVEVFVPLPEGSYRAIATPETYVWRRRFYVPLRRRDDVRLDIPGGIPFSGKGENSWDCGDDGLFGCGGDTIEDAIAQAVKSVLRARRRYGHDSKGTGRAPAVVLNAEVKL